MNRNRGNCVSRFTRSIHLRGFQPQYRRLQHQLAETCRERLGDAIGVRNDGSAGPGWPVRSGCDRLAIEMIAERSATIAVDRGSTIHLPRRPFLVMTGRLGVGTNCTHNHLY